MHGAIRDTLPTPPRCSAIEADSVSDNPIVLRARASDDEIRTGGNFHGMPVAVAMDAVAAALVSLASISERRLYRLLDPKQNNGLPAVPGARRAG